MHRTFAYFKYRCVTDCKEKFTKLLQFKVTSDLGIPNHALEYYKHGYTGGVDNLYMDASIYAHGGSRKKFYELLEVVQKGDVIFILKIEETFNSIEEFTNCLEDFRVRGIHLYSIDDDFCSDLLTPGLEKSVINLVESLCKLKTMEDSITKQPLAKNYPENFDEIYLGITSLGKGLTKAALEAGLSVPTLRKLISMYEK